MTKVKPQDLLLAVRYMILLLLLRLETTRDAENVGLLFFSDSIGPNSVEPWMKPRRLTWRLT